MKITNSNKFFIPPIRLDMLIFKHKENKYSVDIDIEVSNPVKNGDIFVYSINYNYIHKLIYKKLSNDSEKKEKVQDIFWSLFFNTFLTNENIVRAGITAGIKTKDGLNGGVLTETIAENGICPLNFHFWCDSPAHFTFLNIFIKTKKEIDSVSFITDIIHCGPELYSSIKDKNFCIPSPDKKFVFVCFSKTLLKVPIEEIKFYNNEITASIDTPHIPDIKTCNVKVFGIDREFTHSCFKRESSGPNYVEYTCLDRRKIKEIKATKNIWLSVSPIEYTIPQSIVEKYTEICNEIARKKMLKILSDTGMKFVKEDIGDPSHMETSERLKLSKEVIERYNREEREFTNGLNLSFFS